MNEFNPCFFSLLIVINKPVYSDTLLIRFFWGLENVWCENLIIQRRYAYSISYSVLLSNTEVAGQFVLHFLLFNAQE